jgi:hypothetical protein
MVIRRSTRRWLCSWLGALLLFMQLAAAAYACPTGLSPADDAVPPAETAAMEGCDSHRNGQEPTTQPLLCKAHCQQGTDTLQPNPAPSDANAAPALAAVLAVLDWRPIAPLHGPRAAGAIGFEPGAAPPGTPPLYLSLQVLRN